MNDKANKGLKNVLSFQDAWGIQRYAACFICLNFIAGCFINHRQETFTALLMEASPSTNEATVLLNMVLLANEDVRLYN
ncbi:hypothetical protein OUZ56_018320 [Daphnia magna]|uniref:Uncharacterized protein n=1 Tax=Daphnia magna TaxID=35525 RepID=A0ABQ9Z8I4_9CRUS|nr:hypothetical protein OUZ56_018320 [Daphnia magna]